MVEAAAPLPAPAWPSIEGEKQHWVSKHAAWGVKATTERPGSEPYIASVPPFIASRDILLSSDTAALAEEASDALIRFDESLNGEIAPFAPLLLRSEAAASSRIENLTASARAILTAELSIESGATVSRKNAAVIVANTRAMQAALELADELTTDAVLEMHRALMMGDPHHASGTWRKEAVWIGTSSLSPVGAVYVAPNFLRVPGLMDDLMSFTRRDDLPRLAQTAVAHAQFETIHPFTDGNGRTGRALMQAMMRSKGLTRNVTVPVSAGLLTNTNGYHEALTRYREGDIDTVVALTAESSFLAVTNASELVSDIRNIQIGWRERVTARSDSGVWALLDLVARQPVITAQSAARSLELTPTNVYRLLNRLEDAGILKKKAEYRSSVFWRSDEILAALDRFAARSGRRGG
ncbi:MAG: cell filamentation protein Fic [Subtercola sp.]|nr:cell filamentation protein Fic [Subtercola sp.]